MTAEEAALQQARLGQQFRDLAQRQDTQDEVEPTDNVVRLSEVAVRPPIVKTIRMGQMVDQQNEDAKEPAQQLTDSFRQASHWARLEFVRQNLDAIEHLAGKARQERNIRVQAMLARRR